MIQILDKHCSISDADFKGEVAVLINKPADWTSFDVVNKIRFRLRHIYQQKRFKVGHSGTLDPMATGLLIICMGKGTKKAQEFQNLDKQYTGIIRFGASTPSYDAETEPNALFETKHIDLSLIEEVVPQFLGQIAQYPPAYSALKVNGVAMYKLARQGREVKLKARPVTIHRFEILDYDSHELSFLIQCSKGTYIRSVAHDLGKALKSGAFLRKLVRTEVGSHRLEDAWELDQFITELEKRMPEVKKVE